MFRGFQDLRLNTRSRASDTTLWPSFTDIMTVILMVFMLTMIVVIIKNAYLAERLRLSQLQQQEMQDQLASNLEAMMDLRSLNIDLEDQLRAKEMQIILLNDDIKRLDASLEAKLAIVERLTEEQQELLENLRIIQLQLAEKDEELEAAQLRLTEISAEHAKELSSLNRQVAELLSQLEEKEAVLLTLSSEKSDLEMALARQRQDFSSLEEKYLKLIRPARSAMGKQVVTVQYSRIGNLYKIMFKDIGETEGREIDRIDLHRRLAELKAKHGYDLYVKIVIPDDSGLSYNEAWDFTKEILSKYDYYYVDGWPGEEQQD
jgi:hypothetical protein